MPKPQPDFLFLFSDEHSFRFLGCLSPEDGGEPVNTPALDQLIIGGTWFTDAYCQMPLCTPSRLCTLTGREVRDAGAWTNSSILRPGQPTIASLLGDAGYATCLVGKMHLGGSRQAAGFQARPYGDLTGSCGHQWEPIRDDDRHGMRARTAGAGVTGIPESLIQDQIVAQESIAWLREQYNRDPDRPTFLCASFSRPHFPLTAPARHIDHYWPHGVTSPPIPAAGDAYDHPMSVGMRQGFSADAVTQEEMLRARAAYFASVSYLDEVIGDMLIRLDNDKLLDNTVIIYSTDHGEMAGEHGVWWKNGWYEGCTRVPLIISTPEQRRGDSPSTICSIPVGLIDLLPTICAMAGIEAPDDVAGLDISPAIRRSGELPRRHIACDALVPRWGDGTEFRMLRLDTYKYVRFRNAPPLLFNLRTDPGEQHNLIDSTDRDDVAARQELAEIADSTMDFDQAEHERLHRDESLQQQFPLHVDGHFMNLYTFPDGRVVSADDVIYAPRIASDNIDTFFTDWPKPPPPP